MFNRNLNGLPAKLSILSYASTNNIPIMATRIQVQPSADIQNALPKLRTMFCQVLLVVCVCVWGGGGGDKMRINSPLLTWYKLYKLSV